MKSVIFTVVLIGCSLGILESCKPRRFNEESEVSRRIIECGVETYKRTPRLECGNPLYLEKENSPYCEPALYNEGLGRDKCDGYQPAQTAWFERSCPNGMRATGQRRLECQETGAHRDPLGLTIDPAKAQLIASLAKSTREIPYTAGVTCWDNVECVTREAMNERCRLAEFGVAQRQTCRHEKHGIASLQSCEDKTMPIYKDCDAKTRDEIEAFIETAKTHIDLSGALLLSHQANIFKLTYSAEGLACFIEKWEQDPLAIDMVNDLKTQFPMFTGEDYSPEKATNCQNQAMTADNLTCSEDNATPPCKAKRAYEVNLRWLNDTLATAVAYLKEPATQGSPEIAQNLVELQGRIAGYLK